MQVVINISKKLYDRYKEKDHIKICDINEFEKALDNCIIIPKGHGRLIDADELAEEIKGYIIDTSNLHYDDLEEAEACNSAYYNCLDEIEDEPTIIEADKRK